MFKIADGFTQDCLPSELLCYDLSGWTVYQKWLADVNVCHSLANFAARYRNGTVTKAENRGQMSFLPTEGKEVSDCGFSEFVKWVKVSEIEIDS